MAGREELRSGVTGRVVVEDEIEEGGGRGDGGMVFGFGKDEGSRGGAWL